jgi:hypothetical protein
VSADTRYYESLRIDDKAAKIRLGVQATCVNYPFQDSCFCFKHKLEFRLVFDAKRIGIGFAPPTINDTSLTEWWMAARLNFRTGYRDIFDSVLALTCWFLWKERNARVFEQKFRSTEQLVSEIKEEILRRCLIQLRIIII